MLVVALVTFGSVMLISVVLFGRSRSDALQSNMWQSGFQAIDRQYPAPAFTATTMAGANVHLSQYRGKPVVINFFASWCVPCVIEHPILMRLAKEGVPLYGVAYKDKPEDSLRFLRQHGIPYARLGVDQPGRVAIDWGLYGVPETYLIDRQGIIRWRWAGPLAEDTLTAELLPLLKKYA